MKIKKNHKILKGMNKYWRDGINTSKDKGNAIVYGLYAGLSPEVLAQWLEEQYNEKIGKRLAVDNHPYFTLKAKKVTFEVLFPFPAINNTVEINIIFDGVNQDYRQFPIEGMPATFIKMATKAITLIKLRIKELN